MDSCSFTLKRKEYPVDSNSIGFQVVVLFLVKFKKDLQGRLTVKLFKFPGTFLLTFSIKVKNYDRELSKLLLGYTVRLTNVRSHE